METLLQEYMEEGDTEKAVRTFHDDMNDADRLEFVVVLEKMLWFGPSESMKRFVRLLLEQCELPTGIRCRMAEQVYAADDPLYVARIREWLGKEDMSVPCRIEWLQKIRDYPDYTREAKVEDWLKLVLHHPSIAVDEFYCFRVLTDAFHTFESVDMDTLVEIYTRYRVEFNETVMYKIMLTQLLLRRDLSAALEGNAETFLVGCLDELMAGLMAGIYTLEMQADICDFFLNTEYTRISSAYREEAQRVMGRLFREDMTSELSIFANRQNVHSESIEQSSQNVLEKLHEKYGTSGVGTDVFQKVQSWRMEVEGWECFKEKTNEAQDKITIALNRVVFDKRLYGVTGDSLAAILGLVWKHIHASDHKEELQKRLLEELMEASGQCSTGIAVRLLNTLSGFDDFMLRISYRESILSKVIHYMNKVIMEIEDESLQEKLLHEMILPPSQYLDRKNFLALFRENIPQLKEDLYEEFKDDISDTDFDLYLKQALTHYEG